MSINHLGLDGWQAWDYALARLYKRTETAEGICIVCDVCGSRNGKMHGKTCPISVAEALISCELRKCQAGHRKLVVYIAGRFRAKDGWLINENVFVAEKAGRGVARLGGMPLVPHSIGAHMAGTEDDTFWLTGTLELMRRCDLVLVLPGWEDSQGARGEIAEAERIGLPVIFPANGFPGWAELRAWLEKPQVSVTFNGQPVQMVGWPKPQMAEAAVAGINLEVEGACLFDGQVLTVERNPGKPEVALRTLDESGESYIWLKDSAAVRKLLDALLFVVDESESQGAQLIRERDSLRAEVIMLRTELKTEKAARKEDGKELAQLAIELGQRVGETLPAAARRIRETATHAEVERLTVLLEAEHQAAEDTRVRTSARIEKLCAESNAVSKALGDHHGMTDEEAALALVAERDAKCAELLTWQKRHDQVVESMESEGTRLRTELSSHRIATESRVEKLNSTINRLLSVQDEVGKVLNRSSTESLLEAANRVIDEQVMTLRRTTTDPTSERDALRQKLGAAQAELHILSKPYDEALELCDRDGMTPAEQIKELRTEVERLKGVCEHHAERLRQKHAEIEAIAKAIGEHDGQTDEEAVRAIVAERDELRSALASPQVYLVPIVEPSGPAPSSEASHITQAGEKVVKKALTRPADSSCTCHQNPPCSHCTWYADRGMEDPEEVANGLVMQG